MRAPNAILILLAASCGLQDLPAQEPSYPTRFSPELAAHPAVRDALAYIDDHFESQVAEWIRITQISAPSRHEGERAAYVRRQLEALDLQVHIDSIGNVIARRRGMGGGPTLVFAAHLDTVHPMETDVTVTRRNGRLYAPGVFDNSASVTNMLAAARAMHASGLQTRGDVFFIGTVQEELGLGGEWTTGSSTIPRSLTCWWPSMVDWDR